MNRKAKTLVDARYDADRARRRAQDRQFLRDVMEKLFKMQRAGREARPLSPTIHLKPEPHVPGASWQCAQPTETRLLETAPFQAERHELR